MIAKRRLGRTELMVSEMVFGGGFVGGAFDTLCSPLAFHPPGAVGQAC